LHHNLLILVAYIIQYYLYLFSNKIERFNNWIGRSDVSVSLNSALKVSLLQAFGRLRSSPLETFSALPSSSRDSFSVVVVPFSDTFPEVTSHREWSSSTRPVDGPRYASIAALLRHEVSSAGGGDITWKPSEIAVDG